MVRSTTNQVVPFAQRISMSITTIARKAVAVRAGLGGVSLSRKRMEGLQTYSSQHRCHCNGMHSHISPFSMAAASMSTATTGRQQPQNQQQQSPPNNNITSNQLRILAVRSGIPMIGFGLMDNMVMITAGEAIDSTFGVTLGISTMAAAGLGQCCSDVAGLTSGGLVDAAVSKLKLPHHRLTQEQLDSKRARLYSTLGACVGVVTGCLMGMSVLLFMDTDKVDRARRAKELKSIFESVMEDGHHIVGAERATLFMLDPESNELWSQVATGTDGIIKIPISKGCVGQSVTTGNILNVPNAYKSPHFDRSIDETTGYKTINLLVVPIVSKSGQVIGAIQLLNKRTKQSGGGDEDSTTSGGSIVPFTSDDETIVKVLASHVAAFIRVVEGS